MRVNKTKIEDFVVGNNDLVLDAGETAYLKIELKNTGQTARGEALCDHPFDRSRA